LKKGLRLHARRAPVLIERRGAFDCKFLPERKGFSQNQKHRRRETAKKLGPLGLTWSCNSRANLDYDTIKSEASRPCA
jgi:hypothetical protein